jgi:hypothetical protein
MTREIIHISQDEKFIELTKYQFNAVYGVNNTYYIVVKDKSQSLIFVEEDFKTVVIEKDELISLAKKLPTNSIIIFHSLVSAFFPFINILVGKHILIWMFFGMEIYNDKDFYKRKKLYASSTHRLYPTKKESFIKSLKDNLRPFFRLLRPSLPLSSKEKKKKIFNTFNYIGLLYKEDFDYISKIAKIKSAHHFHYTYYPLEKIIDINDNPELKKNKIMIGNSGHLTSNHFDVFKKISNYSLENNEIIMPLSYGNGRYIERIKNNIPQQFNKNKMNLLTGFLPLEDYNLILKHVNIFILYTKRQQGVGNVIALIWHGAKVFLSHKNTFYHFLKRIGVIVYCYETELTEKTIKKGLTLQEIKHNRDILYEHLNEKYLLKQLKQQLDKIL